MCIRTKTVLNLISDEGEFMTKTEIKKIIESVSEDMDSQSKDIISMKKEIELMKKDINDVKADMREVKTSQSLILEQLKQMNNKLNDSQIEEKAFAYEQNQKILHNWKVIVSFVILLLFSGIGIYNLIDKQASNIATITSSIK